VTPPDSIAGILAEFDAPPVPPVVTVRKPSAPQPLSRWTQQQVEEVADADARGLSEDALAIEFVRQHGAQFRWSPGMGWMKFEGTHWARDDHRSRYSLARHICRQAAVETPRDAKRLGAAKTVAAVVTLAESDPRLVLPATAWDAHPQILNTPDGAIDLRTGDWVDGAEQYTTQITRVGPADVPSPHWDVFLQAVFLGDPEMIAFIQRLLGYLLTADRSEQKLFFWYGLGANGKSTLADLLLWIVGTYGLKLPANVLMQSPHDRHPTELAQLRAKRLAMSSELDEAQFWAESRIKELTGDEVLTARFMRGDFFEFPMTQTHVIVGNYKPRLRGGDAAIARRFVLIPFQAKFEGAQRDPAMLDKLKAEAPAILAWMIEGAIAWHGNGLQIPEQVSAASREYMVDNDDVALWLAECCVMEPGSRFKASDLYESFTTWIKARGQHAPSMRLWGDRMGTVQGLRKVQSNGVRYEGVRLSDDENCRQLNLKREAAR
jgi:putative DNA primase/helicase